MWHAITPVSSDYDPILYEGPESEDVLVFNAGPGQVSAKAWSADNLTRERPDFKLELRPGDQRVICGSLVRVELLGSAAKFAAVGWQILSKRFWL